MNIDVQMIKKISSTFASASEDCSQWINKELTLLNREPQLNQFRLFSSKESNNIPTIIPVDPFKNKPMGIDDV